MTKMVNHRVDDSQYSLIKIITIWAVVSVPMPILAYIIAPILAPNGGINYGLTVWILMIAGMIWQFIVSMWILYRELETFTWGAIKERIWLQKPQNPNTGAFSYKFLWWLIPAFLFYFGTEMTSIAELTGNLILIPFPQIDDLPKLDLKELMLPELFGAWWLMAMAVISCIFNYFLGEELLFRGILLPKMRGAFGKWDWAANSALFALYHMHRPTQALGFILGGFALSFPSRHFKSIWFAIILHGFEGIFVLVSVFAVVTGLAF
ncbi:MAG: CPBP family intramembrane glutamic endopeptidase [Chakrabartia sp.]